MKRRAFRMRAGAVFITTGAMLVACGEEGFDDYDLSSGGGVSSAAIDWNQCGTTAADGWNYCKTTDVTTIKSVLNTSNKKVMLYSGTYSVSDPWFMATGTTLKAYSANNAILKRTSATGYYTAGLGGKALLRNKAYGDSGITIDGITMNGDTSNYEGGSDECVNLVRFVRVQSATIKNSHFYDNNSDAVSYRGTSSSNRGADLTAEYNDIDNVGSLRCNSTDHGHGFDLYWIDDAVIRYNSVSQTYGVGILFSASTDGHAYGNVVTSQKNTNSTYAAIRYSNGSSRGIAYSNTLAGYGRAVHLCTGSNEIYVYDNYTGDTNNNGSNLVLVEGPCNMIFCNDFYDTTDADGSQIGVTPDGNKTLTRHNLIRGTPTNHTCGGTYINNVCENNSTYSHVYNSTTVTDWTNTSHNYCATSGSSRISGLKTVRSGWGCQ